jgi:hypothetical protein
MQTNGRLENVRLDEKGLLKDFTPVEPAPGDEPEEGFPPTVTHE